MALWILLVLVMGSYRSRDPGLLWESGGIDWEIQLQIAGWAILGCGALVGIKRGQLLPGFLRSAPILWVAVFIVFGMISSVYSPAPAFSFFRAVQLAIALALVLMSGIDRDFLYQALAAYVLLNVAAAIVERAWFPSDADVWFWRLGSSLGHPSFLGVGAAVGAAGLWARWLKSGLSSLGFIGLCMFVVVTFATVSRTAIAGMVGAMALATLFSGKRRGYALAAWILLLGTTVELSTGLLSRLVRRGQTALEFASLTSRTEVWKAVYERIPASGMFGEGLGSTRWLPRLDIIGLGHSHNIYLEVILTLGFLGAILVTLILVTWIRKQFVIVFHGHGRWTLGVVDLENLSILLPLLAFCLLDRGFMSLADPLVPVYFAAMRLTQEDHALTSARARTAGYRHPVKTALRGHLRGGSPVP
jgi:O-antigen ligase